MTAIQITTKVVITLLQKPEFIAVIVPTDCLYKFNKTILPRPYLLASGERRTWSECKQLELSYA